MVEYTCNGTAWKLTSSQAKTFAPLAPLGGNITWAVGGGVCSVFISLGAGSAVTWAGGETKIITAAAALPVPAFPNGGMGLCASSAYEAVALLVGVTAAGAVSMGAQWSTRTLNPGGWVATSFTYPIA